MKHTCFSLECIEAPDSEPVSLAEMKRHLREFQSSTDIDEDINALIIGGRQWAERFTGRALFAQKWRLALWHERRVPRLGFYRGGPAYFVGADHWWRRAREIMLRRSPVIEITSFVSLNEAGEQTTIDAGTYMLRDGGSKWPRIAPLSGASWATLNDLQIEFRAGFEDEDAIPICFKQAIKLWAEANYDRDPQMMPLLIKTAEGLLTQERSGLSIA